MSRGEIIHKGSSFEGNVAQCKHHNICLFVDLPCSDQPERKCSLTNHSNSETDSDSPPELPPRTPSRGVLNLTGTYSDCSGGGIAKMDHYHLPALVLVKEGVGYCFKVCLYLPRNI